MRFEDCVAAQKHCIAHLSSLRYTMATSSFDGCQYVEGPLRKEVLPYLLPLEIISAAIVKVSLGCIYSYGNKNMEQENIYVWYMLFFNW